MTSPPTGRLITGEAGHDLVLTRTFRASAEDVWASITEPERTARWFASWTGDAGPGKTIRFKLVFEEDAPEAEMTIDVCEPPRHLAVRTQDEHGTWCLDARLSEEDGVTMLTLVHHLDDVAGIGEIGPGWEYYLDMLVASRDGRPRPAFDEYYPAQRDHYAGLV